MVSARKVRAAIGATVFTVVCVGGFMAGADLKGSNHVNTEKEAYRQASPDEQISLLQARRRKLLSVRATLNDKVQSLRQRIAERESVRDDAGE